MAVNKAYSSYQATSVANAKPEELTLMLYNGLMRFIMQAQKGADENNVPKIHENIVRAQNIIEEFQVTLDMQYEISQNLMRLYDYMYRRLVEANLKKDRGILVEVLGLATELRNTWAQAINNSKMQAVSEQAAAK